MAVKRVTILALAGMAFAESGMAGDMGLGSSDAAVPPYSQSMSDPTPMDPSMAITSAVPTPYVSVSTPTPAPITESILSSDQVTSMPMESSIASAMTLDASSMTTISTPVDNMSSQGGMDGMPMGTGGMVMPNATATATSPPIQGSAGIHGVSVGLFLVSMALTAIVQL